MKKTALIFIAIVTVIILMIIGLALALKPSAGTSNSTGPNATIFPVATSSTSSSQTGGVSTNDSLSITPIDNGSPIITKNFLAASDVQANPDNNAGYYVLAGATSAAIAPNPPYEIDYSSKDQSFGISIYQEPLGSNRLKAEQDLMNRLGINQTSMCRLNYILATGPGVSTVYNGQNLGFSFCPNAVVLP